MIRNDDASSTAYALRVFHVNAMILAENVDDVDKRVQIEVIGEPLVAKKTSARYDEMQSCIVLYDSMESNMLALRNSVRQALAINGLTIDDVPIFKTVDVSFRVSFFVRDMTKSTAGLLKFVTDALETVVFNKVEQLEHIQGCKYYVEHHDEESILIEVRLVHDEDSGV
jgi:hypothetical protein